MANLCEERNVKHYEPLGISHAAPTSKQAILNGVVMFLSTAHPPQAFIYFR